MATAPTGRRKTCNRWSGPSKSRSQSTPQCGCYKSGSPHEQQHGAQPPRPHCRRRRRRAHPRPAAPLPGPGRLRGPAGRGRQVAQPGAHARHRRPDRARPDAARRGRPVDLPPPARRQRPDADHHADRQGRGRRPHRRPGSRRRRLPAQALQPARTAGPHPRRAAPPPAAGGAGRAVEGGPGRDLRPLRVRPVAAPPDQGRRADRADHRRVLDAQGPGAPPAPAAVARQAGATGARARVRALRPQPGRADLAPAQDARARPGAAALHPDRVGRGLRVRAGRRQLPDCDSVPRQPVALSLFWRTFFLLAILLAGGIFAWVQTLRALEFEPRAVQDGAADRRPGQPVARGAEAGRRHQPRGADQVDERPGGGARGAAGARRPVGAVRGRPLLAPRRRRNCAPASAPTRWSRRTVNGQPGLWVGFTIESDRYWLQAEAAPGQPADQQHLVRLDRHRAARHAARLGRHRAADQPAAARPVVRRQPHPRGRPRFAAGREHADQRDPRGQHGLQPHGARTGQGRGGPRGDAGRHQPRPAHAAGAAAAGNRDERVGRRGQAQHGAGHRPARRHHRQVHGLRAAGRDAAAPGACWRS